MKVSAILAVAVGLLGVASAAIDPKASVPAPGQFNRFRSLPRGSNLALTPVDGAEFLAGQRFDISIELHSEDLSVDPSLAGLEFTINGQPAGQFLNASAPFVDAYTSEYFKSAKDRDSQNPTQFKVARLNWRDLSLPKSGSYEVSLKVGAEEVKASWIVKGSSTRKAKNVVLFIGDGMASSMISAARYVAKETRFGKFHNGQGFFSFETFDTIGKVATNGIDSMLTDSANSAASYNNGQKTYVNALNVYGDTSASTLDDPKVETLASMIRRLRPNMCIGVVTTAAVHDATPAAVYAYTRSRGDTDIIIDQNLNGAQSFARGSAPQTVVPAKENIKWSAPAVQLDVLLGGGGDAFFAGGRSLNKKDQYAEHAKAGYKVVYNGTDLRNYSGSDKLLGIFHYGTMNVWEDRVVSRQVLDGAVGPLNVRGTAKDQPGLKEMTLKAIEVMEKRCTDGYYLMAEAASVDKQMHPIDFDRGLADLLELDDTVKAVVARDVKKETQIFLTSDHAQGYDVVGTVDLEYMRAASNDDSKDIRGAPNTSPLANPPLKTEKRQAIGTYDDAGWVDSVIDENGLPTRFSNQRFKLAGGKMDSPGHVENFEHKATPRSPAVVDGRYSFTDPTTGVTVNRTTIKPNPADVSATGGIAISGLLPEGQTVTAHTLQSVDLYCRGPASLACAKVMDNTEIFFLMADALGLGDVPDAPTSTATATATTTVSLPATITHVLTTTAVTCPAAATSTATVTSTLTAVITSVVPASTVTVGSPAATVTLAPVTVTETISAGTTLPPAPTVTVTASGVCSAGGAKSTSPAEAIYGGDDEAHPVKSVSTAAALKPATTTAAVQTKAATTAGNIVYNAASTVAASGVVAVAGVVAAIFAFF
ncbi:hypothetical protein HDU96_001910 [Phlyctochytrium bullatum]|nr:hypothetical protein HDU96_001910 [Phlyctochytrium bullatum]